MIGIMIGIGIGWALSDTSIANYNRLNEWPLQFMRTARYNRANGYVYLRTSDGYWWTSTTISSIKGYALFTWPSTIQDSGWRGTGVAIRCGARWRMALASPIIIV